MISYKDVTQTVRFAHRRLRLTVSLRHDLTDHVHFVHQRLRLMVRYAHQRQSQSLNLDEVQRLQIRLMVTALVKTYVTSHQLYSNLKNR